MFMEQVIQIKDDSNAQVLAGVGEDSEAHRQVD